MKTKIAGTIAIQNKGPVLGVAYTGCAVNKESSVMDAMEHLAEKTFMDVL